MTPTRAQRRVLEAARQSQNAWRVFEEDGHYYRASLMGRCRRYRIPWSRMRVLRRRRWLTTWTVLRPRTYFMLTDAGYGALGRK